MTLPTPRFVRRIATLALQQSGSSLTETALLLPLLLIMLAGAVDIGRLFRAYMIVNEASRTGAAYGIHHPTDTAGMILAAKLNTSNMVTVTPTASYGCECSDGSGSVASCATEPSCSMNSIYYVQLSTTATYVPILPWTGISKTFALSSKVRLRASR